MFRPPEYAALISPHVNAFPISFPCVDKKATEEKRRKIKAGGYPLPEDWSPRGVLPTKRTSGMGLAEALGNVAATLLDATFFVLPYVELQAPQAPPRCRCPFSLAREPEKACPDCGAWVSLT